MNALKDICGYMMASQSVLKNIAALRMLKYRQKYGQFIVEGRKNVYELIHSDYEVETILATPTFLDKSEWNIDAQRIGEKEYQKISTFETPPGIIAVAKIKNFKELDINLNANLILALDRIADPGNLGTIIRTADWYGINQVVLAHGSTDFYNPKTIAATMGAFTRCTFIYTNLAEWLYQKNSYGCFLEGADLHALKITTPSVLVIGSESHGISKEVTAAIQSRITIPGAGKGESLNASVAAGIAIDNFVRLQALK